jgi:uncharacterized phage-associated protein
VSRGLPRAYDVVIPTADDVLAAAIDAHGPLDPLRAQKLLYYAQAWHLAWYGEPMFDDTIEAWSYGPVVASVWHRYKALGRGQIVTPTAGDPDALDDRRLRSLCAVLEAYGHLSGPELVRLTHAEGPWRQARGTDDDLADGNTPISRETMSSFYRDSAVFGGHRSKPEEIDDTLRESVLSGDTGALTSLFEKHLGVLVESVEAIS